MVVKSSKSQGKPQKQGNIFDAFAKQMLGQILMFVDFLLYYADKKFVAEISLKKIQPAPTHYFGKTGKERIADLVFQCFLKNGGGDQMAIIVFEHQSKRLKEIPFKLLKIASAIWEGEKKDGRKILSAPYFLVLRTGKTRLKQKPPKLSASFPKGRDGKPVGSNVEVEYDVVDLPAWDFDELVGGPELRLTLGMLHKMAGGNIDDLPAALRPLLEIANTEKRIDLAKDVMPFAAQVFAAHDRRLDDEQMDEILKPIFKGKERAMIKTIFEEKYDAGVTVGKAEAILIVLRERFKKVPKATENAIRQLRDPVALDSWTAYAASCQSMDEFAAALK